MRMKVSVFIYVSFLLTYEDPNALQFLCPCGTAINVR